MNNNSKEVVEESKSNGASSNNKDKTKNTVSNSNNDDMVEKDQKDSRDDDKAKHWNVAIGWSDNDSTIRDSNKIISSGRHKSVKTALQHVIRKEHKRARIKSMEVVLQNTNPLYKFTLGPMQNQMNKFKQRQTKPYGLFVLLPMLFLVYPTICSIMYSIGKRIPIVEQAALKILYCLRPLWLMLMQNMRRGYMRGFKGNAKELKKFIY